MTLARPDRFSDPTITAAVGFLGTVTTHARVDQVVLALATVEGRVGLSDAIVLAAVKATLPENADPAQSAFAQRLAEDGFALAWRAGAGTAVLTPSAPATVGDSPGAARKALSVQPAALALILNRHSQGIKHLGAPGPTDADLALMAEAALAAPDHAALVPFRFKVIRDDGRDRLAQLFVAAATSAGKSEASIAMEVERAKSAPVILAVVARLAGAHPLVPPHEQWVAIGGAVTNFLNAAHALGFAGKLLSGAKVRHPALVAAFCEPEETLLGWISLGTATKRPDARRAAKPSAESLLQPWPSPGEPLTA